MSSPSLLHRVAAQYLHDLYKRKQSDSFLSQPGHTIWVSRHRNLRTQYLHMSVFLWKQFIILGETFASSKFLFINFLTTLLFRHLATESFIVINVWYRMKCFSGDSFSFFKEQVILIFHLLFSLHVKFKQGIQRH